MRLSMWILYDWLKKYRPEPRILQGEQVLRSARILSSETDIERQNVLQHAGDAQDKGNRGDKRECRCQLGLVFKPSAQSIPPPAEFRNSLFVTKHFVRSYHKLSRAKAEWSVRSGRSVPNKTGRLYGMPLPRNAALYRKTGPQHQRRSGRA